MNTLVRKKRITLILAAIILVIALLHLVLFIFLNINGKNILKDYIRKNFSAEAEIRSVSFRFPFTVVVKGFKSDDVEFNKADISLGLFNPFNRSVNLSKVYIDRLNFKVKIEKDKFAISPFISRQTAEPKDTQAPVVTAEAVPQKIKPKTFSVKIGKLLVNNASAQVLDLTKDTQVTFNLRNINIILKHFVYPGLPKFYLEANASLDKGEIKSDNLIAIKGWADYSRKNMDVKFNINNADYIMFSDYYPPFWKPDNLGIKDAKLSLDSKINSLNNDLVIEAVLMLDKLEFKEEMQNDSRVNSLKTMIAFFKGEQDKPALPIKLRTKMDSFHIDLASLQSEFKGKMRLDIGTIVINILDKAKDKITETTKDVKAATIDKAVDKTSDTVKGVTGAIGSAINGNKQETDASQPEQAVSQSAPVNQPTQPEEANTKAPVPEENTTAQSQQTQTDNQEKNTTSDTQPNVSIQTSTPDTQATSEGQTQGEAAQ